MAGSISKWLMGGVVALALGGIAPQAWAQLAWEQREIKIHPELGQEDVEVEFKFTNTGKYPLTILRVEAEACDCLLASLAKHTYQVGESGVIKAVVHLKGLSGEVTRSLQVVTDEKQNAPIPLRIQARIPEIASLDPVMVVFTQGQPAEDRLVTIKAQIPGVVTVKSLRYVPERSSLHQEALPATLVEVEPGRTYQMKVSPKDLAKAGVATWELNLQAGESVKRSYSLRLAVLPALSKQATTQPASSKSVPVAPASAATTQPAQP